MRGETPTATRGSSLTETKRSGGYKRLFQGITCTGTTPGGGKTSEWGQLQALGEGGRGQIWGPGGPSPSGTPAHLPAPVRPGITRRVRGHK